MPNLGLEVLLKGRNMQRLLEGLWVAVRISLISAAVSIVLGLVLGMLLTSKSRSIKLLFRPFLQFLRSMTLLVLLCIVYLRATLMFGW